MLSANPHRFAADGLEPCDIGPEDEAAEVAHAVGRTGLKASSSDVKRMILLTWNRALHEHCVPLLMQMLRNTDAVEGCKVLHTLAFSGLDILLPKVTDMRSDFLTCFCLRFFDERWRFNLFPQQGQRGIPYSSVF